MSEEKKEGIFARIFAGFAEHAKRQHEITKARHASMLVTPADAKAMFFESMAYAKLTPAEKQELELEAIKAGLKPGQPGYPGANPNGKK